MTSNHQRAKQKTLSVTRHTVDVTGRQSTGLAVYNKASGPEHEPLRQKLTVEEEKKDKINSNLPIDQCQSTSQDMHELRDTVSNMEESCYEDIVGLREQANISSGHQPGIRNSTSMARNPYIQLRTTTPFFSHSESFPRSWREDEDGVIVNDNEAYQAVKPSQVVWLQRMSGEGGDEYEQVGCILENESLGEDPVYTVVI